MARTQVSTSLQVDLGAGRGYVVRFAPLDELGAVIEAAGIARGRCILVTDENVGPRYARSVIDRLSAEGFDVRAVTLPPGEATKSCAQLRTIYDGVLSWGIERRTPVVALGGGVVGDLAGFAAATMLRGLPLVQVPTTLIAQVDSAIGGKTGINHEAGKNLIGSFHQPSAVLADTSVLQSLPRREWTSGLAEVIKHGLIADAALFEDLEARWDDLLMREARTVDRTIPRAARVKIRVVSEDELERGRRAILNFGHTFGHAIEKVCGYGTFTHGEAVAAGMRAALHLSKQLHPGLESDRADRLIGRIPVPSELAAYSVSALMEAMKSDKKVRHGRPRFVLLDRIGHAYLTDQVARGLVEEAWAYARDAVG